MSTPATNRAKLLRFNPFREKTVEVPLPQEDGTTETVKVLIRQPSVAARDKILAEMLDDKGQMKGGSSLSRRQAVTVIQCCLDPETRQPLFQDTDAEALAALPSGSWLDILAGEATELMSAGQEAVTKSPPG